MSEQASENVEKAMEYRVMDLTNLLRRTDRRRHDDQAEAILETHVVLTKADHAALVRKAALVDAKDREIEVMVKQAIKLREALYHATHLIGHIAYAEPLPDNTDAVTVNGFEKMKEIHRAACTVLRLDPKLMGQPQE